MIADLKPYAEYKESGLPWLGKVPRHWDERRLRSIATQAITNGVGESAQAFREDWPRYVRITDIADWRSLRRHTRASLPHSLAQGAEVRKGDLLIAAVGATFGKAYVHASDEPACCAGYLVRVRLGGEVDPQFAGYWTESQHYWGQLRANVIQSTIQNFSAARVKRLLVVVPPYAEQAAIVRFLDWANGRLERAIRAKRKVIALLNEQKQAIIHRAVTRGLDPSVPLKPSGIPWLGDIPAHWEVRRAKYLFREVDERSEAGAETHLAMSQKLGLVPSTMVQSTLRSQSYAGGKLCRAGDLVLNRLKAHLGVFAVASQEGVISPDYTVLRREVLANADYYACILRSPGCRGELRKRAKGIVEGFWRLYTDDFYDIYLPAPPISEQRQILKLIASQTRAQDTAISRLEREIDLLREYRTRLVADVVTGKLDVREAAAHLPEEEALPDTSDTVDTDNDLDTDEEADA